MFKPVPNQIDFVAQEHEILEFWRSSEAFQKLLKLRAEGPRWSFIDGPITANNPMGVHHGWGRTYKDLFHRLKAMQGYRTRYQNGFDCQGLWVEVNVERDMGFRTKRDIEAYGLAEFVILCKQRVLEFSAVQTEQSIRLGYWMDWDDPAFLRMLREQLGQDPAQVITVDGPEGPVSGTVEEIIGRLGMREIGGSYFTFSDENNYTIWRMLKSCHERGWIYKGRDVMPWCGRCGTGLSQHEIVTEGYRDLTHPSITLRFPLKDRPGESLLVWTTTPWTLSSNVAAAVGANLTYVRVRQSDEVFYLSKQTLHMLKGELEVEGELAGSEMEGWRYHGPFDELPAQKREGGPEAHRVILWDEVGEDEGTGIVHIAPGCGAEDFALSKEHDLPTIAPLNESGVFVDGYDWLTGMHAGETADAIFENLTEKGMTYSVADYTHRYPVCWRCGEELVFRLVDEWFISMGEKLGKPYEEVTEKEKKRNLRYQIMEVVVEGTRWYPAFGFERELDWLRNMDDWMISKKRYWGLALPIYVCETCGEFDVIGGKEELEERAVEGWDEYKTHSPHRPYVDAVKISCSKCGEKANRIPDVGDPWLDAGIVGMSTLRYKDDLNYWSKWFPADLISESFPGQFRNWFYSLLAMSTILERKAPFRDVFTYGTLLAEDGREMHKSWGNAIEFNEAADKMGVDVMRWMYCDHKPEKNLMFGYQTADEARRQFLIPLWNVYSFFATYARIDGWTPDQKRGAEYTVLDRWILSRLQELVLAVAERLERYEPNQATAAVNRFVDDLSNWYLRRCRRRFWAKSGVSKASDVDKHAAYSTLYRTLVTLSKLLAPFVPFVTEVMYQNLVRILDKDAPESVHHCDWPEADVKLLDERLNRQMALVMRLVSLGHAARNQSNVKVRQPLAEASFAVGVAEEREVVEAFAGLIQEELNVRAVRLLDAASEIVEYQLHPLPRQLGQKYGADFPKLKSAIMALDASEAAESLLSGKSIEVELDGKKLKVLPDEVEVRFEAQEGFAAAAEGGYVVGLDTTLTPDLISEGLMREFVRRVQAMRKDADLMVDDRIEVAFHASERLAEAIAEHEEFVMAEILATDMQESEKPTGKHEATHTFDEETLTVAITPQGKTS
jgi:isoleucyl-tRNA synthetase